MSRAIQWVFSGGRDAWSETESRVMPRNSKEVMGPSIFSGARGTPSSWNVVVTVLRLCNGGEDGGVTMRKSSRRWRTWGSLWLFVRIQQSTSDRESNISGLLLHVKVRRTGK